MRLSFKPIALMVAAALAAVARQLASPHAVIVILVLAGVACGMSGVYLMLGVAWTLLAACLALLGLAVIIARGVTGG